MKRFLFKVILFVFPLVLPFLLFIFIDPFMMIGNDKGKIKLTDNYNVTLNRDYQSTELFLKNYEKQNYDSFILGNSRSFFYNTTVWQKYITGVCFHFNSSAESLYGIERKLHLLDEKKVNIKNVLIVVDNSTFYTTTNSEGHLFVKHPALSGESYVKFFKVMFKGFFYKPMFAHIDLILTGKRKDYMKKYGIRKSVWRQDHNTNQLSYFFYDSIININPKLYYDDKEEVFYKRDSDQLYSDAVIGEEQKKLIQSISSILKSHNTKYRIVINPLYDQIKINKSDLDYLKDVFGKNNVFDFSGQNRFTDDYRNYYETSHYRPNVSSEIIEEIYK